MRNAFKILVKKCDGKTELGRQTHTQEDNIKTDLQNKKCEDIDLIHYMWDSPHQILVKTVMNFQIIYTVGNLITTVASQTAISMCFNAITTPGHLPGKASSAELNARSPGHALVCMN